MTALYAALFLALASGCGQEQVLKPLTHPKTILLIRHAEKPSSETDIDLSPEGKKRAEGLPELFKKSKSRPEPFPVPDFIFATKASKRSNRPAETVEPLAKALKLDIDKQYANEDYAKLVLELQTNSKYEGKTVLICWHHGTISDLTAKLGAADVPAKWDGQVFDRVWQLTYDKGKPNALIKRPQSLMPGDGKE